MTDNPSKTYIKHSSDLPRYSPPGHAGTTNIRLFDRSFCASFEMVLGEIEPGGIAERHSHDKEHAVRAQSSSCHPGSNIWSNQPAVNRYSS